MNHDGARKRTLAKSKNKEEVQINVNYLSEPNSLLLLANGSIFFWFHLLTTNFFELFKRHTFLRKKTTTVFIQHGYSFDEIWNEKFVTFFMCSIVWVTKSVFTTYRYFVNTSLNQNVRTSSNDDKQLRFLQPWQS